jgi:hypothetical protein
VEQTMAEVMLKLADRSNPKTMRTTFAKEDEEVFQTIFLAS